jgi:hypothetical protein
MDQNHIQVHDAERCYLGMFTNEAELSLLPAGSRVTIEPDSHGAVAQFYRRPCAGISSLSARLHGASPVTTSTSRGPSDRSRPWNENRTVR